ncbi:P-loop containing nucleoside triphosphate hydrolase protein [Fomitopsis serialis]|uniref:P-loop containing nucleoside triphosphate hydrolase protein n=1 Tax=Fomitopsis serialis TaxID=139415 RepID=UPI002007BEA2|nr:P-loop containing nucleoside triphosphate hydrolase protein [Neoantrodia serialis]KAH9915737.1 P-loop containing nucleoside triphosphate hydrolase protein [Neoantrodia serialis]
MEAYRRRLMEQATQDGSIYPDVTRSREGGKPSFAAAPCESRQRDRDPRTPPEVIELSDSEDELQESPLRAQPMNTAKAQQQHRVPVHIPSNRDIPRAVFDMQVADNLYDVPMTAADTEKAIQDLVSGAFGETEVDASVEDLKVPGLDPKFTLLLHQVAGRKWMADRETGKANGGILADDMGLGKTIQTIVRIVEGRAKKQDQKEAGHRRLCRHIDGVCGRVVCPVAVVSQWASEVKRMAPGLIVVEHHGPKRTSARTCHVVASSDSDSDSSSVGSSLRTKKARGNTSNAKKDALFRVQWWRAVLGPQIKNRNTKAATACCALESKYRWCLTALNDWPTFNSQIAKPVKANRTTRAMKRLHVVLSAVMLRRTKTTIRVVEIVDCEFDAVERAFYDKVNELVQNRLEKLERQGGLPATIRPCSLQKDREAVEPKGSKSQDGDDKDDADDLADQLEGMGLSGVVSSNTGEDGACTDCARRVDHDLPPDSSKTRQIMDILREIDERSDGRRELSSFRKPFLKAEGIVYVRYDGSMNKAQREYALEAIKKEDGRTRVILISFKAGSTGLNLTCCNNVILVDLWWNPALEVSASALSFVYVQRRLTQQRILELQDKKRELAKAALSGDKMKNMRLGADELAALFRPGGHDEDSDSD